MYRHTHEHVWMDAISAMTVPQKFLMMAFGLSVLGLLLTTQPGYGAKPSSIENEMSQERKRLKQLQKKIAESKEKATQAKKQHGSVLKKIEQLDQRLYRKKKERNRIDKAIKEKDQELAHLSVDMANLDGSLQTQRDAVTARLGYYISKAAQGISKHCLRRRHLPMRPIAWIIFRGWLNESMPLSDNFKKT